jgi:hypothetical protein
MRTVTEESLRRRLARLESAGSGKRKGTPEKSVRRHPLGSRDEAYQMYPLIPKGGRTDWENQGGETATLPNVRRR